MMVLNPVCQANCCPHGHKIPPLPGAVGWLSLSMCGRQYDDPPCPLLPVGFDEVYGRIGGLPVVSHGGSMVLSVAADRLLEFLPGTITLFDLAIMRNWAAHFTNRGIGWAVVRRGCRYSLYRVL